MGRVGRGVAAGCLVAAGCAQVFGIDSPNEVAGSDASSDSIAPDATGGSEGGGQDATSDVTGDSPASVETGSSSGADSSSSGKDSGSHEGGDGAVVCTPASQQCTGAGNLSTCNSVTGQLVTSLCATAACSGNSCAGSTAGNPNLSCQATGPGLTDCGADCCCTSDEVPEGTYYRTYTNAGGGPTGEGDPATVTGFRLDKYLVTVGRFRQFVEAGPASFAPAAGSGKHTHLNGGQGLADSSSTTGAYEPGWLTADDAHIAPTDTNLNCVAGWSTWTPTAGTQENLPINCVNWWEAYAFCIWDGGFLPSEAEWEYAAAGGSAQREYPWGATDPGTMNKYAIYSLLPPDGGPAGCYYPNGPVSCSGAANIAPVGTADLGGGLWGQLDLGGEVVEWTLDWYGNYATSCTDCAYVSGGTNRVARGGLFNWTTTNLLPPTRPYEPPSTRVPGTGFRCARKP